MDYDEVEEGDVMVRPVEDDPIGEITRENVMAVMNRGIQYEFINLNTLV